MKLYVDSNHVSPYALSAFVALTEKRVPFEVHTIDIDSGEHRMPPYAERSGTVRVPMLEHDGFRLTESSAIAEYLEEALPPPEHPALYPGNIQDRARARQIQAWLRSDLLALRQDRPTEKVFPGTPCGPLSAEGRAATHKLFNFALALICAETENLFGDWSIADTDLAVMLNRLVLNGDEVPPALARYASRQWQLPPVRAWLIRLDHPADSETGN